MGVWQTWHSEPAFEVSTVLARIRRTQLAHAAWPARGERPGQRPAESQQSAPEKERAGLWCCGAAAVERGRLLMI